MKRKSKLIGKRGRSGLDGMRDRFGDISRKDAGAVKRGVSENGVRLIASS